MKRITIGDLFIKRMRGLHNEDINHFSRKLTTHRDCIQAAEEAMYSEDVETYHSLCRSLRSLLDGYIKDLRGADDDPAAQQRIVKDIKAGISASWTSFVNRVYNFLNQNNDVLYKDTGKVFKGSLRCIYETGILTVG